MFKLLGVLLAVTVVLAPSAEAHEDHGRVTGLVSKASEAAALPCGVGNVCIPKQGARWSIDQLDGCTIKSDVTTGFRMMGDCVLDIDEGDHLKLWAPLGAVDEDFAVIWEG